MLTLRGALGMAAGACVVGLCIGWAARPSDAGWYGAGLAGSVVDCGVVATDMALVTQVLGGGTPDEAPIEWWMRRTGERATLEVVRPSGGQRLELRWDADRKAWAAVACAAVTPSGTGG